LIGGGNNVSRISDVSDGSTIAEYNENLAGSNSFWISWSNNVINVGFGNVSGIDTFMSGTGTSVDNYTINLIGISMDAGSNGE